MGCISRHARKLTPLESAAFLLTEDSTDRPGRCGQRGPVPHHDFNRLYLDRYRGCPSDSNRDDRYCDDYGKYKPTPDSLLRPDDDGFYVGTWAFIGEEGKPLGKKLVIPGVFEGRRKVITVHFEPPETTLVNTLVMWDMTPKIELINPHGVGCGTRIRRWGEVGEVDEIIMRMPFRGLASGYIRRSDYFVNFETYGYWYEQLRIAVGSNATGGPFERNNYYFPFWRSDVMLHSNPHARRWVAYKTTDAIDAVQPVSIDRIDRRSLPSITTDRGRGLADYDD